MPHVIYPMKTSIHTFSGHNTFSVRDIVVLKYVIPPFIDLHVYYLSNSCGVWMYVLMISQLVLVQVVSPQWPKQ